MAKKFVRGITDIKEINKQDFDTNNVNDLLSDGKHNYIHRKKEDNSEEYHNLTNNLKTITSDNTDLLSVTNDNNSTNSATVHPKHDTQKEQIIEPANNTVSIVHGENATTETTKLKVSDELVETINNKQDKLTVGDGLLLSNNKIKIYPTDNGNPLGINGLYKGTITDDNQPSSIISLAFNNNDCVQLSLRESAITPNLLIIKYRFVKNNVASQWKVGSVDKETLDNALSQKQNTLVNNASIGVAGTGLRQLYALKQTYTATGGILKTHVKSLSVNTNINVPEEEFNFIVKLDKNVSSVNFTLNSHDTTKFANIMSTYGENNTVRISGCVFTLNGTTLTVSTTNNTQQNYVIIFSDII